MKTIISVPSLFLGVLALSSLAHSAVLVSESFNYTAGGVLNGQGTTGGGLNASWAATNNTQTTWNVGGSGLSMAGVASSGNSAVFSQTAAGRGELYATRSLSAALPASSTIYGSFLFSITQKTGSVANAQFGIVLGSATDTDNNGSYYYSGDGYGTQNPLIKAEGTTVTGGLAVTEAQTYIYLFQANAATGTTTAWILNAAQYANFSGSLDAGTLNAAATNTEAATGVVFRSTVTAASAVGTIDAIRLFGYSRPDAEGGGPGPNGYQVIVDEFRISDVSLTEAATLVPEASTALLGCLGSTLLLLRRRAVAGS